MITVSSWLFKNVGLMLKNAELLLHNASMILALGMYGNLNVL